MAQRKTLLRETNNYRKAQVVIPCCKNCVHVDYMLRMKVQPTYVCDQFKGQE